MMNSDPISPSVDEEVVKRQLVRQWLCSPLCLDRSPEQEGAPEPVGAYLNFQFSQVGFIPGLDDLLWRAPLVIWATWNDYIAIATNAVEHVATLKKRPSLYAKQVLELARNFSAASLQQTKASCVAERFRQLASTRDVWPGSISKFDLVTTAEARKLKDQNLRLSGRHRDEPMIPQPIKVALSTGAAAALASQSDIFSDAPRLVQCTSAAFFQLAVSRSDQAEYADLILDLAGQFIAAVDPCSASPALLRDYKILASEIDRWPGWLTRPKFAAKERAKLQLLPLGIATGLSKVRGERGIPAVIADRLLVRLRKIDQMPFWRNSCDLGCTIRNPVRSSCKIPKCPMRAATRKRTLWSNPRCFWAYHYIAKIKPPFDSKPENWKTWKEVAQVLLYFEHGTTQIRKKARLRHFEAFKENPRIISDHASPLGKRAADQNLRESKNDFAEGKVAALEREEVRNKAKIDLLSPVSASDGGGAEEPWPCALADRDFREYLGRGTNLAVKTDDTRFRQICNAVLNQLATRFPKPPAP